MSAKALIANIKKLETESDIEDAIASVKASMISNIDKTIDFMPVYDPSYFGIKKFEDGWSFGYNTDPLCLLPIMKKALIDYINNLDFFISVIIPQKGNIYGTGQDVIISFETPLWMFGMIGDLFGYRKKEYDFGAKCCLMNVIPDDVSDDFYKNEFYKMKDVYGTKVYNMRYPTLGHIDRLMAFTPNTFCVKKSAMDSYIADNKQKYLASSERLQYAIYHRFITERNINWANLDYCSFSVISPSTPKGKGVPCDVYGSVADLKATGANLPTQVTDSLKENKLEYAGNVTVCFPYDVVRDAKEYQRMMVLIPTKEIRYSVDKDVKSRFLANVVLPKEIVDANVIGEQPVVPISEFWTKTDLTDRMLLSDALKKFIVSSSEKQAKWDATRNVIGTFRIDPKSNGKLFITQAFDADMKQIDLNKSFMSDPDGYLTLLKDILGSLDIKDYYSLTTTEGVGVVFVSKKVVSSLKLVKAVKSSEVCDYLGKDDMKIGLSTAHGKVIWYSDEITGNKDLASQNLKTLEEMFTATIGKENYDSALALIALGEKDPFKKLKLK